MSGSAPTSQPAPHLQRNRRALLIFLAGLFLILWAWVNMIFRLPQPWAERPPAVVVEDDAPDRPSTPAVRTATPRDRQAAFVYASTLLAGFLLALLFLIGSYVFIRGSRWYRTALSRQPPAPTPTPDIWSMHKVPEDYMSDDYDPDSPDFESPGSSPGDRNTQ
jgi:hypothetical protein